MRPFNYSDSVSVANVGKSPVFKKLNACLISVLLSFALMLSFSAPQAFAKQTDNDIVGGYTAAQRGLSATNMPSITAKCAYVVDSDGNVYFERNANKQVQIASITKIMTCILALENADMNKQITVSNRAATIGESTAQLAQGDVLDLKNALIGMMVPSGNDAAYAIAENVGADIASKAKSDGSKILDASGNPVNLNDNHAGYNAFVAKMNEKAKELGMENTLFTNPHGLDADHVKGKKFHSSAKDVSIMSVYGMQNETFRDIVNHGDTTITVNRGGKNRKIRLEGTDILIGDYDGACGIKTGFTDEAGGCFSGAVNRDGNYLYAVVLGASSNEQKFDDTKTIYDWVYGNVTDFPLVTTDEYIQLDKDGAEVKVPVLAEIPQTDWIDKTVKATISDPSQTVDVNAIFGNVSQVVHPNEVNGDIKAGDVVGTVEYYQGNQLLKSVDLISCENSAGPNIFESAAIAIQRLFGSFAGAKDKAEMLVFNKTEPILSKA